MNQFVSPLEIKHFLINISEKIDDKNLPKFCKTQLTLNDYSLNQNDFLASNYIEESNKQFIYTSKESKKNFYFELFYDEIKEIDKEFICVLCYDVIYLYKNHKIYYFQVLDFSLNDEEINNLIYEKLNIQINEIIKIDSKTLTELKIKGNIRSETQNLNSKKSFNYFRVFISYIFILVFICTYVLIVKSQEKPKSIDYKKYSYKSQKLDEVLKNLKINGIIINKIDFDRRLKLFIDIKNSIYNETLIYTLRKKFKIINSSFDEKLNQYKVELYAK